MKSLLQHFSLFFSVVAAIASTSELAQAQASTYPCVPDSSLWSSNQKWWYPGEPLKWVPEGELDSLLEAQLDGFNLNVNSPRVPGYNKTIVYRRFGPDAEVLYVEGDCRYISYDPKNRTNHSSSIVVGHTYFSCPFWLENTLYLQNGFSNWHVHAQQLWHSQETGEWYESKLPAPPDQIGFAAVHPCDSGLFFIRVDIDSDLKQEGQGVYFLHHGKRIWEYLGTLNTVFGHEYSRYITDIEDYWVFNSRNSFLVRRKSDGLATIVSSPFSAWVARGKESKYDGSKGRSWEGNVIHAWYGSNKNSIDIEELTSDVEWLPFYIPGPSPQSIGYDNSNGSRIEMIILGAVVFLLSMLLLKKKAPRNSGQWRELSDAGGYPPLSEHTRRLMEYGGQSLDVTSFDTLCQLNELKSPETRRSRRSNIIKMVNAECLARFGYALIERERFSADKRVVVYRLREKPEQEAD